MKDIAYIAIGIISAVIAAWRMWIFATARTAEQHTSDLAIAVVCILIAIAFIGLFLAGRVNKEEEIHITK
jgi:hypothetical protein